MLEKQSIGIFSPQHSKDVVIDPSRFRSTNLYIYLESMSVRLIDTNRTGKYYNLLAQDIKVENNCKDYTITLKEAFFSDGSTITAHDVVQSFKRLILFGSPHSDPKSFIREAQNLKSREDEIEGLRVIDEKTLFIGLNNPMKEIFYFLQLADYGVLHHSQYNKDKLTAQDWTKITSGVYHLHYEGKTPQFIANKKTLPYHPKMPQVVVHQNPPTEELLNYIENNKIHLGYFHFKDYLNKKNQIDALENLRLYSSQSDLIMHLVLNIKSKKFATKETRQWFLYQIFKNLTFDHLDSQTVKKAYQYFLPQAKGYLSKFDIQNFLKKKVKKQVPKELEDGVTIHSLQGMKDYSLENLGKLLTQALQVPIKITYDITNKNYFTFLKKRSFDILFSGAGMSYKVLGETLNLAYTATPAKFLDPTKKIKANLNQYQQTDIPQEEEQYIHKILLQMLEDAECIPLFYGASPYFYNHQVLQIDKIQIGEIPQIWKTRLK